MSVTMLNIDCMEFMRGQPDKAFDLAIVDPPYFSGPERRMFYGQRVSSIGVSRLYRRSAEWKLPEIAYFDELRRVARNYIFWGQNYFQFPFHSGRIIWDKVNESSDFSDCEIAATDLFDHVRIFRFMWNGMLQGSGVLSGAKMQGNKRKNEHRIHPTQKPVALYKWLLTKYAKLGWKILDTHGGSGSIAIACHDLGFDLTWMELDKDYYEAAVKRYQEHAMQGTLFETPPVAVPSQGSLL